MPVDLTRAGKASPYPMHGPRFPPWLAIWVICCAVGATVALLLWPKGVPATGLSFWFCVLGIPNIVFLVLLGIARAGFEAMWLRASFRNKARRDWLVENVKHAQSPMQLLGVGYCLPLGDKDLATVMTDGQSLMQAQTARSGVGVPVHNRFNDASLSGVQASEDERDLSDETPTVARERSEPVASIILKIVKALEPLSPSLHALSQYGPTYAPAVRVLARDDDALLREQQVREALTQTGLVSLECLALPAKEGLMVADTWLDSGDHRPLLVIAADWHDSTPPVNGTEGCVAVLLNPGFYHLPEPVRVAGLLHRPVAGDVDALGDLLKLALIWGQAEAVAIRFAWITGWDIQHDSTLLAAWKAASLEQFSQADARRRPDRIVGDAGPLNPWLSVAAAIASGTEGPQLIMDRTQAAVLYVTPSPHDDSDQ